MTTRKFKDRLTEHHDNSKCDVITESSGRHFTKNGHSVTNMKGIVLEKSGNPSNEFSAQGQGECYQKNLINFNCPRRRQVGGN